MLFEKQDNTKLQSAASRPCIALNNALAVPAFSGNKPTEETEVLGYTKPAPNKNKNKMAVTLGKEI